MDLHVRGYPAAWPGSAHGTKKSIHLPDVTCTEKEGKKESMGERELLPSPFLQLRPCSALPPLEMSKMRKHHLFTDAPSSFLCSSFSSSPLLVVAAPNNSALAVVASGRRGGGRRGCQFRSTMLFARGEREGGRGVGGWVDEQEEAEGGKGTCTQTGVVGWWWSLSCSAITFFFFFHLRAKTARVDFPYIFFSVTSLTK